MLSLLYIKDINFGGLKGKPVRKVDGQEETPSLVSAIIQTHNGGQVSGINHHPQPQ